MQLILPAMTTAALPRQDAYIIIPLEQLNGIAKKGGAIFGL
jgi:hypothetical protein